MSDVSLSVPTKKDTMVRLGRKKAATCTASAPSELFDFPLDKNQCNILFASGGKFQKAGHLYIFNTLKQK